MKYLQYTKLVLYLCDMKEEKKKDTYCTNLRLPTKLAEKMKKVAKVNKRSLNSEIENALTGYIERQLF